MWSINSHLSNVILMRGVSMKQTCVTIIILMLLGNLSSCEAQPQYEIFNVLLGTDSKSPVLLKTSATDRYTAEYQFDEMVFCSSTDFSSASVGQQIESVYPYEDCVVITFTAPLVPGERVSVNGKVADRSGNSLTFTAGVWGVNERVPQVQINEFSTKGSGNNPDRVELTALSSGNLAGVTLYHGMPESFDSEYIFPSVEVDKGDYIVIVYSEEPSGSIPLEFAGGVVGLGANNGVISLCERPEGTVVDAVLYSNRTSSSDDTYGGFGTSKVYQWVQELEISGEWGSGLLAPESGIDSTNHTATRTFCRTEGKADTNTKSDWHIVPTRGATFGAQNITEIYNP